MKISVSMALEALKDQVAEVTRTKAAHERALAERDDLIQDAHENKVPMRLLTKITGLSRDRIYTIAGKPRRGVSE